MENFKTFLIVVSVYSFLPIVSYILGGFFLFVLMSILMISILVYLWITKFKK